jgi:hypothetical protein
MGVFGFLRRRRGPAPASTADASDPADPLAARRAAWRAQRDAMWRRMLENAKYPYELVPGTQAQAALEAARVAGRKEGFSPLAVLPGGAGGGFSTRILNVKSRKVHRASRYFERRASEWLELFDSVNEIVPTEEDIRLFGEDNLDVVDTLSESRPLSPYGEVAIFRLPCLESWKIPLFVHVGAPLDQSSFKTTGEEIGIQQDWYERFGAELCCIGERSWQFRVSRPPRDHIEAVALLREHYLYSLAAWDGVCSREMIENFAASLRTATWWPFSWI